MLFSLVFLAFLQYCAAKPVKYAGYPEGWLFFINEFNDLGTLNVNVDWINKQNSIVD